VLKESFNNSAPIRLWRIREKEKIKMGSLNKAMLIGNLGKDPEVRAVPSGVKVANFSIATTESYTDRNSGQKVEKTQWHNIVMWRGLAEVAEKYLRKGSQVFVEGRIETRSWDDQNGQKRYMTEIIADNMVMLGGRPREGISPSGGEDVQRSPSMNSAPPSARSDSGFSNSSAPPSAAEEDLPF
jgi:single-strand DNA-binding protein